MSKFLTLDFGILLIVLTALMMIHELGHYIAYRILGFEAVIRRSFLVPGIDPNETIEVSKLQGLIIALGGFLLSMLVVVLPAILIGYKHGIVVIIAGVAGSIADFMWALTMLFMKRITIYSK